jgi:hypothetical protein
MNDLSLTRCVSHSIDDRIADDSALDWSAGEDWALPLPVSIECFGATHGPRAEDPAADWNPL